MQPELDPSLYQEALETIDRAAQASVIWERSILINQALALYRRAREPRTWVHDPPLVAGGEAAGKTFGELDG